MLRIARVVGPQFIGGLGGAAGEECAPGQAAPAQLLRDKDNYYVPGTPLLIAAGADAKAENSDGETPADLALAWNSDAQALALLDAAVMRWKRSKMPKLPLELAAEMRAAETAIEAAQEYLKQSKVKVAPHE